MPYAKFYYPGENKNGIMDGGIGTKLHSIPNKKENRAATKLIPIMPGKEAYERVNFLYQAAMSVVATQPHNIELARHYLKCIRDIKEKKMLRLSREMKHSICDRCNMLVVPGITADASVCDKGLLVRMTCLSCNTKKQRRFVTSARKKKGKCDV